MRSLSESIRDHRHEEIREIYVSELVSIMLNDQRGKVRSRVEAIIDRHSRGDLVHAADALSLLWSKSTQRDDAAIPLRAAAETELPVRLLTARLGSYANSNVRTGAAPTRKSSHQLEIRKDHDSKIDETWSLLRPEVLGERVEGW